MIARLAERAVAACFYPPKGARNIGPRRATGLFHEVGTSTWMRGRVRLCAVQIETDEAVENVVAIYVRARHRTRPDRDRGSGQLNGLYERPECAAIVAAIDAVLRRVHTQWRRAGIAYVSDAERRNAT